jgi:NADPH:quinone reductase-like Zn-dependent oxidoreductase
MSKSPRRSPDEALIRVRASTLNRADLIVASGRWHRAVGGARLRDQRSV